MGKKNKRIKKSFKKPFKIEVVCSNEKNSEEALIRAIDFLLHCNN
jgi:hypothetical protein